MSCLHCGADLPSGALFCGECGRAAGRAAPHSSCESCGARMSPTDIFCGECGQVARSAAIDALDTGAQPTVRVETAVPDPPPRRVQPERRSMASDTESLQQPGLPLVPGHDLVPPGTEIPLDALVRAPARVSGGSSPLAPEIEDTRIVTAPGGSTRATSPRFVLQFSTGESVTVAGTGLIGRNPTAEPGEYFDNLVRILDLTRSVSKTHLQFGHEQGEFWLTDRYSGNGTILRPPERAAARAEPGKRYLVVRGSRVDMGEQFFVVS